uniref:Mitochondrial resolvase Ydc2 catalytic domain-containing protein n=1 Tax=viral metagenome TaxID=1070528 RepID=A0A6C0LJB3_9ZZZZ
MTNRYISIDVATKSLAISIIDYNSIPLNLRDKNSFKNLKVIKTITKDLAPGEANNSISEMRRISLITKFIKNELLKYIDDKTIILIERQIATTPTYIVYISLMTLFIERDIKVETIMATRKNQLVIDEERIGKYLRQCKDSYIANKEHSKALVECIRTYMDDYDKIDINKKYIRDWSDTISQLIAFLINTNKTQLHSQSCQ